MYDFNSNINKQIQAVKRCLCAFIAKPVEENSEIVKPVEENSEPDRAANELVGRLLLNEYIDTTEHTPISKEDFINCSDDFNRIFFRGLIDTNDTSFISNDDISNELNKYNKSGIDSDYLSCVVALSVYCKALSKKSQLWLENLNDCLSELNSYDDIYCYLKIEVDDVLPYNDNRLLKSYITGNDLDLKSLEHNYEYSLNDAKRRVYATKYLYAGYNKLQLTFEAKTKK